MTRKFNFINPKLPVEGDWGVFQFFFMVFFIITIISSLQFVFGIALTSSFATFIFYYFAELDLRKNYKFFKY